MGYLLLDDLGAMIFFQWVSARDERGSIILTTDESAKGARALQPEVTRVTPYQRAEQGDGSSVVPVGASAHLAGC